MLERTRCRAEPAGGLAAAMQHGQATEARRTMAARPMPSCTGGWIIRVLSGGDCSTGRGDERATRFAGRGGARVGSRCGAAAAVTQGQSLEEPRPLRHPMPGSPAAGRPPARPPPPPQKRTSPARCSASGRLPGRPQSALWVHGRQAGGEGGRHIEQAHRQATSGSGLPRLRAARRECPRDCPPTRTSAKRQRACAVYPSQRCASRARSAGRMRRGEGPVGGRSSREP